MDLEAKLRDETTKLDELLSQFAEKPPLIAWIEERMARDEKLGINIGMQEGLFLQSLCTLESVKNVVEIGSLYGCSASWMAVALEKRGTLYCFEKDPLCVKECEKTFDHPDFKATGCQVEIFPGDALENLNKVNNRAPFDLIFIDANKSATLDYLSWAKEYVRKGGMIVIDNVFLFGTMFSDVCPDKTPKKMWEVMRNVLQKQLSNQDYKTSIIPTAEGLLLSVKK